MSCSAINQTHRPSDSTRPQSDISGIQQRIGWQPYTKRIDSYSVPADSYADINGAFDKSAPMMEFQQKLAMDNPIYSHMGSDDPDPINAINKNIQSVLNSPSKTKPGFRGETLASIASADRNVSEALYTPKVSYPYEYPLYRTDRYDPDDMGSELLEGYSVDANISGDGMSWFRFFLWILLIVVIIYGIYYMYNKNSNKNASGGFTDLFSSSTSSNKFDFDFNKKF